MTSYLKGRLLQLVPVLFGISILTFSLIHLAPGDPAFLMLQRAGIEPTPEALAEIRKQLGFDLPIWQQYLAWLRGVLMGDLGVSMVSETSVTEELLTRMPATLELALASFLVLIILAFPLGLLAATYSGRWPDHLLRLLALLGASMPRFWLGLILISYFGVIKNWLPFMGRGSLQHLILPALTLGLGMGLMYARLLRANLLDTFGQEYMKTGRARGIKPVVLLWRYGLKNALLPMLTVLGMGLGYLLGGSAIVETVFSWPGVGKYAVESILNRDYPVIQGYALFMGFVFVSLNLLVDLLSCLLDPRIRLGQGKGRLLD